MKNMLHKFKFKDTGTVINAPKLMEKEFIGLGLKISLPQNLPAENTVVFINKEQELLDFLNKQLKKIKPDGVFWLAYPKMSSKNKTDINRDTICTTAFSYGIQAVTVISIDDTWSALRFRPIDKVGK